MPNFITEKLLMRKRENPHHFYLGNWLDMEFCWDAYCSPPSCVETRMAYGSFSKTLPNQFPLTLHKPCPDSAQWSEMQ